MSSSRHGERTGWNHGTRYTGNQRTKLCVKLPVFTQLEHVSPGKFSMQSPNCLLDVCGRVDGAGKVNPRGESAVWLEGLK